MSKKITLTRKIPGEVLTAEKENANLTTIETGINTLADDVAAVTGGTSDIPQIKTDINTNKGNIASNLTKITENTTKNTSQDAKISTLETSTLKTANIPSLFLVNMDGADVDFQHSNGKYKATIKSKLQSLNVASTFGWSGLSEVINTQSNGNYSPHIYVNFNDYFTFNGSLLSTTISGNKRTITINNPITQASIYDEVKKIIKDGTNVNHTIDETNKTITINSVNDDQTALNLYNALKNKFIAGSNTTIALNDTNGTWTISSTGGSGGSTFTPSQANLYDPVSKIIKVSGSNTLIENNVDDTLTINGVDTKPTAANVYAVIKNSLKGNGILTITPNDVTNDWDFSVTIDKATLGAINKDIFVGGGDAAVTYDPTTHITTISATDTKPTNANIYPIGKNILAAGNNVTITPADANQLLTINATDTKPTADKVYSLNKQIIKTDGNTTLVNDDANHVMTLNAPQIATNKTDIVAIKAKNATQDTSITTNAGNINNNFTNIATNTTNIGKKVNLVDLDDYIKINYNNANILPAVSNNILTYSISPYLKSVSNTLNFKWTGGNTQNEGYSAQNYSITTNKDLSQVIGFAAGTNMSITHSDVGDKRTFTFNSTGGSGGDSLTETTFYDKAKVVLKAGSHLTFANDDVNKRLTINADSASILTTPTGKINNILAISTSNRLKVVPTSINQRVKITIPLNQARDINEEIFIDFGLDVDDVMTSNAGGHHYHPVKFVGVVANDTILRISPTPAGHSPSTDWTSVSALPTSASSDLYMIIKSNSIELYAWSQGTNGAYMQLDYYSVYEIENYNNVGSHYNKIKDIVKVDSTLTATNDDTNKTLTIKAPKITTLETQMADTQQKTQSNINELVKLANADVKINKNLTIMSVALATEKSVLHKAGVVPSKHDEHTSFLALGVNGSTLYDEMKSSTNTGFDYTNEIVQKLLTQMEARKYEYYFMHDTLHQDNYNEWVSYELSSRVPFDGIKLGDGVTDPLHWKIAIVQKTSTLYRFYVWPSDNTNTYTDKNLIKFFDWSTSQSSAPSLNTATLDADKNIFDLEDSVYIDGTLFRVKYTKSGVSVTETLQTIFDRIGTGGGTSAPTKDNTYTPIKSILKAGSGVSITPNDTSKELTISTAGGGGIDRFSSSQVYLLAEGKGRMDRPYSSNYIRPAFGMGAEVSKYTPNNEIVYTRTDNTSPVYLILKPGTYNIKAKHSLYDVDYSGPVNFKGVVKKSDDSSATLNTDYKLTYDSELATGTYQGAPYQERTTWLLYLNATIKVINEIKIDFTIYAYNASSRSYSYGHSQSQLSDVRQGYLIVEKVGD